MLRPRWSKVLRDLFFSPTRTILVVLSIAIGVFAFGTIMAARFVLVAQLRDSYLAVNPASAILTTTAFDEDLLDAVRNVPGVAEAQGRRVAAGRILVGPDQWQDVRLFVLPDDGAQAIDIARPWQGMWPAPDQAVLIERSSLGKTRAAVGDTLHIELPGQSARDLPIAGLTHDLSQPPAVIVGQAIGYLNEETLRWLGGPAGYNQVLIVVGEGRDDVAHIQAVAAAVERVIERGGREVLVTDVPNPPLQHPAEVVLPTVLSILTVLGLLALLISGFLIVNTIGAILAQQTRQIGIMKSIGARSDQIMGLYFAQVAAFGVLALVLAWPMGIIGGYLLTGFVAGQLNLDIVGVPTSPLVLLLQALVALLVPMITAAGPIRSVVIRPAREALSGDTRAPAAEHTPLDALLNRVTAISRPTRLALRNTFRRRGRLVRTLVALALGGAVFITVMTLRISLFDTLDESIASQRYDIEVRLSRMYREAKVAPIALATPGVTSVESTLRAIGFPVHPDGSTGEEITLRALPATTALFSPKMAGGRWLQSSDTRAIVLTTNYLTKAPSAALGDTITLQINDTNYDWQIVGFIEELIPPVSPAFGYVTLDGYTQAIGGVGRTDTLRVATAGHDPQSHAQIARALERAFTDAAIDLQLVRSRTEDRAILSERFNVLTGVLSVMAVIIGTVGGLGLAGTMSINVLERTREIGIMRAIGASDAAVRQIVLSESIAIGVLSWVVATIISVPMSIGLCYAFGKALLNAPLVWNYAVPAVFLWLGIVLLIAAIASLLPARAATRLTVREVLAYE